MDAFIDLSGGLIMDLLGGLKVRQFERFAEVVEQARS
jgi:hypothetical protein